MRDRLSQSLPLTTLPTTGLMPIGGTSAPRRWLNMRVSGCGTCRPSFIENRRTVISIRSLSERWWASMKQQRASSVYKVEGYCLALTNCMILCTVELGQRCTVSLNRSDLARNNVCPGAHSCEISKADVPVILRSMLNLSSRATCCKTRLLL